MANINRILTAAILIGEERDLAEERQTEDLGPKDAKVDRWEPNWKRSCECCGDIPVVNGVADDEVVYKGTMCGVCTWGESAMLDPENWNK